MLVIPTHNLRKNLRGSAVMHAIHPHHKIREEVRKKAEEKAKPKNTRYLEKCLIWSIILFRRLIEQEIRRLLLVLLACEIGLDSEVAIESESAKLHLVSIAS
jgi:hypothetical protein